MIFGTRVLRMNKRLIPFLPLYLFCFVFHFSLFELSSRNLPIVSTDVNKENFFILNFLPFSFPCLE